MMRMTQRWKRKMLHKVDTTCTWLYSVIRKPSVTQSVSYLFSQFVGQLVSQQSVWQAVSNSARQSLTLSVSHSVGQSVTQLDSQSLSQLVSQSVSWAVSYRVSCSWSVGNSVWKINGKVMMHWCSRPSLGYRYGKTLVPLTRIDKDSMKLPTERCLSVLCFTSNENVSNKIMIMS